LCASYPSVLSIHSIFQSDKVISKVIDVLAHHILALSGLVEEEGRNMMGKNILNVLPGNL